jgi:hypothetical protein
MITICYIILTCEKYLPTRAAWQRENCFKHVNSKNLYYISCKPGPNSVYGWNTTDDYISCPLKYIEFFRNMDLDYDWYVFIDDDTFIFPDRFSKMLAEFDSTKTLYIGIQLEHMLPFKYMGGGASFTLSKSTYKLVKNYVLNSDIDSIKKYDGVMIHGDVTMGQWIININKQYENIVEYVSLPLKLSSNPHKDDNELINKCSFHYVNTEELFILYGKYINK